MPVLVEQPDVKEEKSKADETQLAMEQPCLSFFRNSPVPDGVHQKAHEIL